MFRDGYLLANMLSGIFFLYLCVYSFRFRKTPEWPYFAFLTAMLAFQGLASMLELVVSDFADKLLWRNVQQIPLYSSPLFLLGLIMSFVGLRRKRILQWLAMLSVPMVLYWILVFTDSHHHLLRRAVLLENYGQAERIGVEPTYLNDFFFMYNFSLVVLSFVLLLNNVRTTSGIRRRQNNLLILSILLPYAFSFVAEAKGWATSISMLMLPAAVLMTYALFIHRFLQIRPIAKEKVLEHMTEGILILEEQDIIIDANPAAYQMAERLWGRSKLQGAYFPKLLETQPALWEFFQVERQGEIEIESNGSYFAVRMIPIMLRAWRRGSLVIITDITERKKYEQQLIRQATIDDLTQLYNRRHFMKLMEKGLRTSRHTGEPISLLLIDVDYFKQINDTYGHWVGDRVLEHFALLLKESFTEREAIGRVGGEEFAVLLPGSTEQMAYERAEMLRLQVQREPMRMLELPIEVSYTISVGVAELKEAHKLLEEWYQEVDVALYESKRKGRNRTTVVNW